MKTTKTKPNQSGEPRHAQDSGGLISGFRRPVCSYRLNPLISLLIKRGAARSQTLSEGGVVEQCVLKAIASVVELDAEETRLLEAANRVTNELAAIQKQIGNLMGLPHVKS